MFFYYILDWKIIFRNNHQITFRYYLFLIFNNLFIINILIIFNIVQFLTSIFRTNKFTVFASFTDIMLKCACLTIFFTRNKRLFILSLKRALVKGSIFLIYMMKFTVLFILTVFLESTYWKVNSYQSFTNSNKHLIIFIFINYFMVALLFKHILFYKRDVIVLNYFHFYLIYLFFL